MQLQNDTKIFVEKIYHIYARGECIYHSLREEEFRSTWIACTRLADLLGYKEEVSYEELYVNKEMALNSSH
jgi:hypothetical protein